MQLALKQGGFAVNLLPGNPSRYIETVRSDAWRERFLEKLSLLEEYESFLVQNGVIRSANVSGLPLSLRSKAGQLVESYSRYELVAAKQYYNSDHLIHFWRWFVENLDMLTSAGAISRDFPVFKVRINWEILKYSVTRIPIQQFEHSLFYKISDQPLKYASVPRASSGRSDHTGSIVDMASIEFESLKGKLIVLRGQVFEILKTLYYVFLEFNRRSKSVVWNTYKIHQFLDYFLYIGPNGDNCGAAFEGIFFNSNISELTLFLEHHFAERRCLSLLEVDQYLQRQRRYYLTRAVSASLEESEALNHCRDLLIYDEQQGIVRLNGLTDEVRQQLREEKIEPYQIVRFDGCPFAKSKGVDHNALLEVYEFFDRLMLHLLNFSPEFGNLFVKQK
jgi:hypothetical protein